MTFRFTVDNLIQWALDDLERRTRTDLYAMLDPVDIRSLARDRRGRFTSFTGGYELNFTKRIDVVTAFGPGEAELEIRATWSEPLERSEAWATLAILPADPNVMVTKARGGAVGTGFEDAVEKAVRALFEFMATNSEMRQITGLAGLLNPHENPASEQDRSVRSRRRVKRVVAGR